MKRRISAVAAVFLIAGVIATIAFLLLRRPRPAPEVVTVTQPAATAWAVGTIRADDGTPLSDAVVTFTNDRGSKSATSDEHGNFRLALSAGKYGVTAKAEGRAFDFGTRDLRAGEPVQLTLKTDIPSETQQAYFQSQLQSQLRVTHLESEVASQALALRYAYAPFPTPAPVPAPEPPVVAPSPFPAAPVTSPAEQVAEGQPLEPGLEEKRCQNETPCEVQVFFATDRNILPKQKQRKREANFQIAFGGARSRDPKKPMTYGWCDVTIPKNHRKTTGVLDQRKGVYDVENSVFIWDVVPAKDEDEFLAKLRDRLDDDNNREMLVFIHGYNTSFFEAARRTAQLHWDLGFRGAPAFFSWPSGGSLLDYWADEASSEWAASHLREFLDLVASRSGAKKIHLIAHSMGSRPLTRALAEIGQRDQGCDLQTKTQFSQVIMAAPDLDRDMFLQVKDAIQNASERVTLYASKRDRAVFGSSILHRFARLGMPNGKPPADVKIEAVDASNASTGFLGHSYYGASILWDVKFVLDHPYLAVDQRCTIDRADPADTYPRFRRQIDPKEVPSLWRRVFRRRPKPDVIVDQCRYPSPTTIAAGN